MSHGAVLRSGIYQGKVFHSRFMPVKHSFSYDMALMAICLDEVDDISAIGRVFSSNKPALLRFNPSDYLQSLTLNTGANIDAKADTAAPVCPHKMAAVKSCHSRTITITDPSAAALKSRALQQIAELGAEQHCDRVLFVGQVRHFGLYFSPVNFYFCYQGNTPLYMLAEVSNTPWNERHCYLVKLENEAENVELAPDDSLPSSDKVFHVSPFMGLDMRYLWHVTAPQRRLNIGISNQLDTQKSTTAGKRIFSANLAMTRQEITSKSLHAFLLGFPFMTLKIMLAIYWQALKLFCKRVPFVPHPAKVER